jgi:peptidoglycan/xylan/chitin deacetylase (PgdA/CDA1 family)
VDSYSGVREESALFVSQLVDLSLKQLTTVPQKLDLLENGRMLLARNSFGWTRIPVAGGLPSLFTDYPSFIERSEVSATAVENAVVSGDGKWLVLLEGVSAAYGNLILMNISSGARAFIASHVEKSDRHFPVRWSPTSRAFIYARDGNLYYYQVDAADHVEERYRLIGEGSIACAMWEEQGDFFYINDAAVYRIRGAEIFFRSMYRDFLEIGYVSGTLPFTFDPDFDEFYVSPDARSLLISKADRTLFFYPLGNDGGTTQPYLQLPELCSAVTVIWSSANIITVFARNGSAQSVYRLNADTEAAFVPVASPGMDNAALSPDGTRAILWGEKGAALYDYIQWRNILSISAAPSYDCFWLGYDDFIIGDEKRIERIHINQDNGVTRNLICLSSADSFAFEANTGRILARNNGTWFVTDGRIAWAEIQDPAVRPASVVSGRYRVYLEEQNTGLYENLPMIRNITSVGTMPLVRIPDSGRTDGTDSGNVIALCFDVYDDVTGVRHALDALDFFGVKATFFLNGECIRQYSTAVKRIVDAGHEAASLFFAPLDLSTPRYIIDGTFISQGLARNEDEFFAATGKELKLLWHPPFYITSREITGAARSLGYKTVTWDVDPGDAITKAEALRLGVPFKSASDMIDAVMEQTRNRFVIPVRLGLLPGGRETYLYNRIFVLLDALINAGYSIVPVSTIVQ